RIAAYTGMLRASGGGALALFAEALTGPPGPSQTAALHLVREASFRGAAKEFANLLPKFSEQVQLDVIEGLSQRDEPSAAAGIAVLVGNTHPAVRAAALKALGSLGADSVVMVLAQHAASGDPDEQNAARQALVRLHRGNSTGALLAHVVNSPPAVQVELACALGHRGD